MTDRRKGIKKHPQCMIEDLKIINNKETWNQASRVQVRGGLLGYEISKCFWMSKYCCMKNKSQSTAEEQSQSTADMKNA